MLENEHARARGQSCYDARTRVRSYSVMPIFSSSKSTCYILYDHILAEYTIFMNKFCKFLFLKFNLLSYV